MPQDLGKCNQEMVLMAMGISAGGTSDAVVGLLLESQAKTSKAQGVLNCYISAASAYVVSMPH
jgi:hypothetical protein